MKFGRIKIWFARGRKPTRFYGGFFGHEVMRRLVNLKNEKDMDSGCSNIARSMKALRKYAEEHHPSPLAVSEDGFTTYWFWRFFLTIRTPVYNKNNSW